MNATSEIHQEAGCMKSTLKMRDRVQAQFLTEMKKSKKNKLNILEISECRRPYFGKNARILVKTVVFSRRTDRQNHEGVAIYRINRISSSE